MVGDIPDVGATGLHVGAVHIGKGGSKAVACGLYRIFRRSMLVGKNGKDALHKGSVLQQHGVDGKNRGGLNAYIPGGLLIELGQHYNRTLLGGTEAVDLLVLGAMGDGGQREGMAGIEMQGSGGNLILNRSSDDDLHGDAPFPGKSESMWLLRQQCCGSLEQAAGKICAFVVY